ncbi:MAG: hypothetical protein ACPLPT_10500 [Moorellales bacterium]
MELPAIWVSSLPQVRGSQSCGQDSLSYYAEVADGLAAVTYDLEDDGIKWLAWFFQRNFVYCKLIVVVYPACATREEHLAKLAELSQEVEGRLDVRVFAASSKTGLLTSMLFVKDKKATAVMIGGAGNLGVDPAAPGLVNILSEPHRVEQDKWCAWFDDLWNWSAVLCPETIRIPRLVPARGSAEAQELWEAYAYACLAYAGRAADETWTEALKGDASATGSQGQLMQGKLIKLEGPWVNETQSSAGPPPSSSPTKDLGLIPLGKLERRIMELYQKGMLVTIDKYSRTPPLDVPIRPEWLGIEKERRIGAASRKLEYRVSLFGEATRRRLETLRKKTHHLLSKFSYALADGQRWMPNSAWNLFETALDNANTEALQELTKAIHGSLDDFFQQRTERVIRDLEMLYHEFHPGEPLPEDVRQNVLKELKNRLQKIPRSRFLPQVSVGKIEFMPSAREEGEDKGWASTWGQALRLLYSIAEYPRKAITDPYYLRGIMVDLDELLKAMDVCDDAVIRAWLLRRSDILDLELRALDELYLLKAIISGPDMSAREKCERILQVIEGRGP